jgi:hypothetical protein
MHDADEKNLHVKKHKFGQNCLSFIAGVLINVSARSKKYLPDKTCSGLFTIAALYC